MLRRLCGWAAVVFLLACGPGIRSKEKVQEAILNRLQTKTGLDLNSLDVTTTAVTFDRNMAYATVSIHPKADPSLQSMIMKYTLEDRDGKWVVTNVADSQGHGMAGHSSASSDQNLPPGHPPIGGIQDTPPPAGSTGRKP